MTTQPALTSPLVLTTTRTSIHRHLHAIETTITRMLDDTGGEEGRDFTPEERRVFEALQTIRMQLEGIRVNPLE